MDSTPGFGRLGIDFENQPRELIGSEKPDPHIGRIVREQLSARASAFIQSLSLHGVVGTLDILNTTKNLAALTNIISYTVPNGQLAIVTHFALVCNNPALSMGNLFVWRLLVNGEELPNMNTSLIFSATGYRTNVGNVHRPMAVTPIVVQPNQRITVEIRPSTNLIGAYAVFAARLVGRLVNPGTFYAFAQGDNV